MIKFFRRIRQQLLSQNKFSKYVFYAIGEIVLVVIGILIALQINNWNEKQQTQKKLESNFQNLIEDLESNKLQLLGLIKNREEESIGASFLIDNYENQIQITENEFITKLYPVLAESYFEINRNGIDKVITSPAFELEQMENIRELIKSYLRISNTLNTFEIKENSGIENLEMITAGNGYFRTVWKSFRNRRYQTTAAFNNPNFDFLKIMENDELLYLLFRYELVALAAYKQYNDLINKGEEILNALKKYENK